MQDRGVVGTTDWTQYDIKLQVPADAVDICFGFLLVGDGTAWGDDFKVSAQTFGL